LLAVASESSRAMTSQQVHATFLDAAMAAVGADTGAVYMRTLDRDHSRIAYAVGYTDDIITSYGIAPLTTHLPIHVTMLTSQPIWLNSLPACCGSFDE